MTSQLRWGRWWAGRSDVFGYVWLCLRRVRPLPHSLANSPFSFILSSFPLSLPFTFSLSVASTAAMADQLCRFPALVINQINSLFITFHISKPHLPGQWLCFWSPIHYSTKRHYRHPHKTITDTTIRFLESASPRPIHPWPPLLSLPYFQQWLFIITHESNFKLN